MNAENRSNVFNVNVGDEYPGNEDACVWLLHDDANEHVALSEPHRRNAYVDDVRRAYEHVNAQEVHVCVRAHDFRSSATTRPGP